MKFERSDRYLLVTLTINVSFQLQVEYEVPMAIQQAQGLALAFSGENIQRKTSRSCAIL